MTDLGQRGFRRTTGFLPIGVSAIGIVAVVGAIAIFLDGRQEASQRDVLELYHLQSHSLASRVVGDVAALQRSVESEASRRIVLRLLQTIREEIDRLSEIQAMIGVPEFDSATDRLRHRIQRVENGFDDDGDQARPSERKTLGVSIESLGLAASQLDRLHALKVQDSIDLLGARASRQAKILVAMAVALALTAFAITRWMLVALRASFEREQGALAATSERLAHSQKIEALGRLAGGVAHDFNNLLTVILGNAESLYRKLPSESPLREQVGVIEAAGDQAASLTRQLLAFSRQDVAEARAVDLNRLVDSSRVILERILREDVTLVTDLDPRVPAVWADPSLVEQVILNLVLNSRDAMPEGGTVAIQTAPAESASLRPRKKEADRSYARLTVSDDGHGIPPGLQERIFDPYFTTKPKGEGTGLGLAAVRGIVEEGSGLVEVRSEVGLGTEVSVFLPTSDEEVGEAAAPATDEEPRGTETILIVEDESNLRALAAHMLADAGYQVLEAADGIQALDLCPQRAEPIDLILTDVVMPRLQGTELAERAKQLHPEAQILFMSGYTDDEVLLRGLRNTPSKLLRKPFRRGQLLERVRLAIGRKPRARGSGIG